MEEEIVLCAANSYEQKYYLNPEFEMLPESIKQELNIMCVLYTEDVGGIVCTDWRNCLSVWTQYCSCRKCYAKWSRILSGAGSEKN